MRARPVGLVASVTAAVVAAVAVVRRRALDRHRRDFEQAYGPSAEGLVTEARRPTP